MRTIKVCGVFLLLITGKHLVTVHERGKEVEGGREGDDLEMGMGWGKRRWREGRQRGKKGKGC